MARDILLIALDSLFDAVEVSSRVQVSELYIVLLEARIMNVHTVSSRAVFWCRAMDTKCNRAKVTRMNSIRDTDPACCFLLLCFVCFMCFYIVWLNYCFYVLRCFSFFYCFVYVMFNVFVFLFYLFFVCFLYLTWYRPVSHLIQIQHVSIKHMHFEA